MPRQRVYVSLFGCGRLPPIIIVPFPTGVFYENQVGGLDCYQQNLEGFLLPLPSTTARISDPQWWKTHQFGGSRGTVSVDNPEWLAICGEIEDAFNVEWEDDVSTPNCAAPVRNVRVVPRPEKHGGMGLDLVLL